jgi:hypothetical protein
MDPIAVLESLSADEIAARLERMYAEEQSLKVLLRAARARERGQTKSAARPAAQPDEGETA